MIPRKNLIILGVILIAVFMFSGGLGILSIAPIATDGVGYYDRGVRGGSNANGGGDLLDTTAYVTSWTGGGNSEKLVIQGHYYGSGGLSPEMPREWYKVTLTVDNPNVQINGVTGTTWTKSYENSGSGAVDTGHWIAMEAVVLTLTNPCSGSVHVELWGHIHYYNPFPNGHDVKLAEDWGNLRSGVGSVRVQNDDVEEGTNANFYVETAFSHSVLPGANPSDAGWILSIFNPNGALVWTKSIQDEFSGTVSWPVPSGAYSPTSSNIYKVVLRNELVNQDDDWLFTVGQGMLSQIPNKPTFKLIVGKEPFQKGDEITVRISATTSTYTITGFWVWVSYETSAGTTTDYLYEKSWFPAIPTTGGAYADVEFSWPDTGYARMEASTADVKALNSGMTEMKFTVYGTKGDEPAPSFDWTSIIIGLFIIIAAIILYRAGTIPKPYSLLIALGMVAFAIWWMYPAVQTMLGG